jgi:DNA-binding IclR family transcriptional regulator
VRERGYAANFNESENGLVGIAVGVYGPSPQPVAALVVAAPSSRLPRSAVPGMVRHLREAASRLSLEIGGAAQAEG